MAELAFANISASQTIESLKDDVACSDYIFDLLNYIQTNLLRVKSTKRAKIGNIVAKFEQLYDNCQKKPDYCTLKNETLSRTNSILPEITEESAEVPDSPGKGVMAASDSPSPVRSGTWPSSQLRRSISIGHQRDVLMSSRRQGSNSSISNREPMRSRSRLVQNLPVGVDVPQTMPVITGPISTSQDAHDISDKITQLSTSEVADGAPVVEDHVFPVIDGVVVETEAQPEEITTEPNTIKSRATMSTGQIKRIQVALQPPKSEADVIDIKSGHADPIQAQSTTKSAENPGVPSNNQNTAGREGQLQPFTPATQLTINRESPPQAQRETRDAPISAVGERRLRTSLRRHIDKVLTRILGPP